MVLTVMRSLTTRALLAALMALGSLTALADTPKEFATELTHAAIFTDKSYDAEEPGAIQWLSAQNAFTTLEPAGGTRPPAESHAGSNEDAPAAPEDIIAYDLDTLERRVLVSAAQLTPKDQTDPLVVDDYSWSADQSQLLIYTNSQKVWRDKTRGDYWLLSRATGELRQLGGESAAPASLQFAKFAPDGQSVAYVRDANLYVESLDGTITALTERPGDDIINGIMSWAYEEEFSIQDGFRWSPDGTHIAFWQFDTSGVKDFLLIDNTSELYPTITRIPYPKVGETISAARIGVVPVIGGDIVWAQTPGDPRANYIPRMQWGGNSNSLLLQHVNRRQNRNQVYLVDITDGAMTPVFLDEEETHLDDFHDVEWLDDGQAFTFISESNGWRHVYRVARNGESVINLTAGDYDIAELVAVDEANNRLFFTASPEDMGARYLYVTSLDGKGDARRVTPASYAGDNSYQMADDHSHAVHRHSRMNQPPQYRLVSLPDHTVKKALEENTALIERLAALDVGEHQFFRVNARDGLAMDGFMMHPADFDPAKSYPVLVYVYGEVAGQTVRDRWVGHRHLWHQLMTQRGYVVVSIDNRGTPSLRGRDWRKSLYGGGKLGTLSARDQFDGLQALLARHAYLDGDRVGIWGHSGGGSMTLNMLFRYPEAYGVGISSAPVADQRLYDAIYQERYSGLLEEHAEGYEIGSPITHAAGLQGKLLLVHGTGDDNVHYQGSERLINELIRLNKRFDFMSYPNRDHRINSPDGTSLHRYGMMTDYFDEHLMGASGR